MTEICIDWPKCHLKFILFYYLFLCHLFFDLNYFSIIAFLVEDLFEYFIPFFFKLVLVHKLFGLQINPNIWSIHRSISSLFYYFINLPNIPIKRVPVKILIRLGNQWQEYLTNLFQFLFILRIVELKRRESDTGIV